LWQDYNLAIFCGEILQTVGVRAKVRALKQRSPKRDSKAERSPRQNETMEWNQDISHRGKSLDDGAEQGMMLPVLKAPIHFSHQSRHTSCCKLFCCLQCSRGKKKIVQLQAAAAVLTVAMVAYGPTELVQTALI
jgi:hypothetical protein